MVKIVVDAAEMRPETDIRFSGGGKQWVPRALEVVAAGAGAGAAGADIVYWMVYLWQRSKSATALHSCAVGIYRSSLCKL